MAAPETSAAPETPAAPERTRTTAQAQSEGLRVFIAGVPWTIGEDTLRRDFAECGVIEDLFLLRDKEGSSTGKCFVTFRDKAAVKAAMAFDNTDYGGRKIYVKIAAAKNKQPEQGGEEKVYKVEGEGKPSRKSADTPAKSHPDEKPEGCRSLCLKNTGDATEDNLRNLLKDCQVQSVRVVVDRLTGEPRGIAFVDFREASEVDKAMAHNGEDLKGRAVEMHYEAPRERPRPEGCMTVAVKKLDEKTLEKDILKLFKGLESISEARVILNKEKLCSGLAFVEFTDPKDVEAAVLRDGMKVKGQIVFVCYETKEKKSAGTKDRRKLQAAKRVVEKKEKVKKKKDGGDEGEEGEAEGDGDDDDDDAAGGGRKAEKRRERRQAKRKATKEEKKATKADEEPAAAAEGAETKSSKKRKRKKDKGAKTAETSALAADSADAAGGKKKKKKASQEVAEEGDEAAKPESAKKKRKKAEATA